MDVCSSYLHKMYNASSPLQDPEKKEHQPTTWSIKHNEATKMTSVNRGMKPTKILL